ncbi:lycopene cyclase [Costertonia aggregata]|uniref:Lycopene cyclase n=2 Tax=Costertonia aggregata TaxID=343403 RepID=A0A7H9AUP8_9FLAO|nr:lycopene cyclase [Costertonia aggregata]
MLADAMGRDAFFADKSILLVDKDAKRNNDRTWCFWENGEGRFDAIVHKKWNHIYFGGQNFSKRFNITPYVYKMIKGVDFYTDYLERITAYPNIEFRQETVQDIDDTLGKIMMTTDKGQYVAKKAFNSLFNYGMATFQNRYPVLQQHFLGWFVKTKKPVFKTDEVTYMDFSIPQKGNTRFMYVLPFSETEALVEYTLFSEQTLHQLEYEKAIEHYLNTNLNCTEFEILEKEKGSIPMTCYDFKGYHTKNMRFIGTAGGWAKPSTGYTFMSTAKKTPVLLEHIKTGKSLQKLNFKNRFWQYDLLFLDVLKRDNGKGHVIFEKLFKNRKPQLVFKFLDEETNFLEELYYMWGSPKIPFTKALWKRVLLRFYMAVRNPRQALTILFCA